MGRRKEHSFIWTPKRCPRLPMSKNMPLYRTLVIRSVKQLRRVAASWDDLWQRSETSSPISCAEPIAQWIEHFEPQVPLYILIVAECSRFMAALPLIEKSIGGMLKTGQLTGNEWAPCGDLLLDPAAGNDALDVLLAEVQRLPFHLLRLISIDLNVARWERFRQGWERLGAAVASNAIYSVGRIETDSNWEEYLSRLSRSHRQSMHKKCRRLRKAGNVRFSLVTELSDKEVAPVIGAGFEVEARSWKGQMRTSVLHTPGMEDYINRQAAYLASRGKLAVAKLELNDTLIAFLYGWTGKGILYAHKTAYNPDFRAFSPGQVLFFHLLELLHRKDRFHGIDFMGPITESTARWRPVQYSAGNLLIAPASLLGKAAVRFYAAFSPLRIRRRFAQPRASMPKPTKRNGDASGIGIGPLYPANAAARS